MNKQNRVKIAAVLFLATTIAAVLVYAAAAGFGRSGGRVAVWSPSVEIDGVDSIGDVVTIGGSHNNVQLQPAAPQAEAESKAHQTGELLGAAFWGVLFLAAVGGMAFAMIQYNKYGLAWIFPIPEKQP